MAPPIFATARLRAELARLGDALGEAEALLAGPDGPFRQAARLRSLRLIADYLEPRLADPAAPPLVGIFGPTGAGKSTLTSSLAGRTIGASGVIRPTTRSPILWCHSRNRSRYEWWAGVDLVTFDTRLVEGLSIVDTPDLDSYMVENRVVAERLLDRCDAAILVTTPQRYADSVPWETLQAAVARRMPLLVVVNRLSRRNRGAVADFSSLLRRAGIPVDASDIAQINEQRLRGEGLLPGAAVKRVETFLGAIGAVASTIGGTAAEVVRLAGVVGQGLTGDLERTKALESLADDIVTAQVDEVSLHLAKGDLIKGEVVARWQRLVGVGELATMITRGATRAIRVFSSPVPAESVRSVENEARDQLVGLMVHRARLAFDQIGDGWSLEPALTGWSPGFEQGPVEDLATRIVDDWLAGLVGMVGSDGRQRFRVARAASLGVNAAATILLVTVFVHTGGLTGAEVGVAAGAAAAQQALFEHLFGAATASRMAVQARRRLVEGSRQVIEAAVTPLRDHLSRLAPSRETVTEIEEASRAVAAEARMVTGG